VSITEEARHQLYRRLEEVLGPAEAAIMMEHLPPVGWADVATKRDLDQQSVLMKHELDRFRDEMHHEIGGLRDEMHHEIGGLRDEMHHRFEAVELRFGGMLQAELRAQTFRMAAMFTGLAAVVVASVKL
jgi:hypothetical protein